MDYSKVGSDFPLCHKNGIGECCQPEKKLHVFSGITPISDENIRYICVSREYRMLGYVNSENFVFDLSLLSPFTIFAYTILYDEDF